MLATFGLIISGFFFFFLIAFCFCCNLCSNCWQCLLLARNVLIVSAAVAVIEREHANVWIALVHILSSLHFVCCCFESVRHHYCLSLHYLLFLFSIRTLSLLRSNGPEILCLYLVAFVFFLDFKSHFNASVLIHSFCVCYCFLSFLSLAFVFVSVLFSFFFHSPFLASHRVQTKLIYLCCCYCCCCKCRPLLFSNIIVSRNLYLF